MFLHLGQTFDFVDLPRIAFLAFLEILLSADNAIVLGLVIKPLAPSLRHRALFIGLFSAFLFRAASLFFVSLLLELIWLQLLAAAYLLYLSISHFASGDKKLKPLGVANFWKIVLLVELFDLAFAMDSIIAGVAFITTIPATSVIHPKLWIVYVGAVIGLIAMRFAAKLFSQLIDSYPRLETSAYLMIAWIGVKLAVSALATYLPQLHPFIEPVFWSVLVLLFLTGFFKRKAHV